MKPPPLRASKQRSMLVTLLAWFMMLIGGLGLPISVITVLMILVKSYGTQTSDPLGFVIIVLGPAIVAVTGFGLLRRWRWAWFATLALLLIIGVMEGWYLVQGPRESFIYTDASGVKTTMMSSNPNVTTLPILLLCVGLLVKLISRGVRSEFRGQPLSSMPPPIEPTTHATPDYDLRGWHVGHSGRDMMYYEEKITGAWQRIDIDGEILMGRAHHVIYFASGENWQSYPEWARHRRSEIMQRVMSEFHEPDYEYKVEAQPLSSAMRPSPLPIKTAVTAQQRAALCTAILIMVGISTGMGWLVKSGIQHGETYMPSKRASLQRMITRQHEPASFWAALSLYALLGLGSGGIALWGVRQALDK